MQPGNVSLVCECLRKLDSGESGFMAVEDFRAVLQRVQPSLSDKDVLEMILSSGSCCVNYNTFLDWLWDETSPGSACSRQRQASTSGDTLDINGAAIPKDKFRICSMNIGGRNTNSFEFKMRGDNSSLGKQWAAQYDKAMKAMSSRGPRDLAGVDAQVDEIVRVIGAPPRGPDDMASKLLEQRNWNELAQFVNKNCLKLINACNLLTLKSGRPSPLEMPENIPIPEPGKEDGDDFFNLWLRWITANPPDKSWSSKSDKAGLTVADCAVSMYLYDAMCMVALESMYAAGDADRSSAQNVSLMGILRHHLAWQTSLKFTTDIGKLNKFAAMLAEQGFPEVVCTQEGHILVNALKDGGEPDYKREPYQAVFQHYLVYSAGETVLLLRRGIFEDVEELTQSLQGPLTARRDSLYAGKAKVLSDWEVVQQRAVSVRGRIKNTSVTVLMSAVHGKPSEATPTFVLVLRELLMSSQPHAKVCAIGMDSNVATSNFRDEMIKNGLGCSGNPSQITVAKERTIFQTQVEKIGVLDVSQKDYIVACSRDGPALGNTAYFPDICDDSYLLPTTEWPFDHAMLISVVNCPT